MPHRDSPHRLRTAGILREMAFSLEPGAEARDRLAQDLGIRALRKLSFAGTIRPDGKRDLMLDATLGATVVQDCVVSFVPVTTRIDEEVVRRYVAGMPEPEADEAEMPEDETAEPLSETLDLDTVMAEALALALPLFPRAEGVEPVNVNVSAPGVTPMTDEEAKPFAGLKSLRDKLSGGGPEER